MNVGRPKPPFDWRRVPWVLASVAAVTALSLWAQSVLPLVGWLIAGVSLWIDVTVHRMGPAFRRDEE